MAELLWVRGNCIYKWYEQGNKFIEMVLQ